MENEVIEIKQKNMYVPICITQLICVLAILIAIIITKYFFGNTFNQFKNWCNNNLLEQTRVISDFDEGQSSEV